MSLRLLVAPLAAAAILLVAPACATAQGSGGWRAAYDYGFLEGAKRGEQDARRGSRFEYRNAREFQRADAGYHRGFGDRERYRQVFRKGFAAGYSDAFSRQPRYGRNDRQGPYAQGGYRSGSPPPYGGAPRAVYYTPGFDNGARDGYDKGIEDAHRNRTFDPLRHSWYRAGDRHYQGRYGSRDQYKDVYRRGFQQGYGRGYQEGRYRR